MAAHCSTCGGLGVIPEEESWSSLVIRFLAKESWRWKACPDCLEREARSQAYVRSSSSEEMKRLMRREGVEVLDQVGLPENRRMIDL